MWDSSFRVASLADIPRRLATPSPDSIDQVRFDNRCTRTGPGQDEYRCVDVDTVVTTTCREFFQRFRAGYGATATINVQPLSTVGSTCSAIEALSSARAARQSAVRQFRLTPESLKYLPPVLGLNVSREMADSAARAGARGVSWARFEAGLRATNSGDPGWPGALTVEDDDEKTRVQILGRGDFDGDGWDDVMVRSVGWAKGGTLVVTQLFILTRERAGATLRVVKQLW